MSHGFVSIAEKLEALAMNKVTSREPIIALG